MRVHIAHRCACASHIDARAHRTSTDIHPYRAGVARTLAAIPAPLALLLSKAREMILAR
jgi:hypothetical protein